MSKKICVWCGTWCEAEHPRQKRCPSCRKLPHDRKEYDRLRNLEKKRRAQRSALKGFSIDEVLRELSSYNKQNGTYLSYGQFVMMRSRGGKVDARLPKKKE